MNFVKEESFLIDYLKSFELIADKDDLNENNSVLDRVIDANYKKKIQLYVATINNNFHESVTRYFISKNFNILFSIANDNNITSFEEFMEILVNYTLDEFLETLKVLFRQKSDVNLQSIDLKSLDLLPLSFEDKWQLALIINDFHTIKAKLLVELPSFYAKYLEYAEDLYENYSQKIKAVAVLLDDNDFLYKNIFSDYLNQDMLKSIQKRLILLISANESIVYYTQKTSLLVVGLYVFDFYLELHEQKRIDEKKLAQIFKVLSDPTRYGIMKSLNQGITSNSVLADKFSISRAAISKQFKYLQDNDILTIDEETKQYIINKDIMMHAIKMLQMDMDLLD